MRGLYVLRHGLPARSASTSWPRRPTTLSIEKQPAVFEIDLFRCVYCGMCVEACPCNAILMDTQEMRMCQYAPDQFTVNKEDLLNW